MKKFLEFILEWTNILTGLKPKPIKPKVGTYGQFGYFPIYKFVFIATCDANQFRCNAGDCKYTDNNNCNGPCIRSTWVNDGEEDCTDGSDEGDYSCILLK